MRVMQLTRLVMTFAAFAAASAQADEWLWERTYSLTQGGNDRVVEMVACEDDQQAYVLCTCMNDSSTPTTDAVVLRYDATGQQTGFWRYNSGFNDEAIGFAVNLSGIYVAAAANGDFHVVKFNHAVSGDRAWFDIFDGGLEDRPADSRPAATARLSPATASGPAIRHTRIT